MAKKTAIIKTPETFVQINLVKGFKYIDRAGEIVNTFYKDIKPPEFEMDINILKLKDLSPKIPEMTVSPYAIWMKFSPVDTMDFVMDQFIKESNKIVEILEIEKVNRIGWRVYFLFEAENENIFNSTMYSLTTLTHNKLFNISIEAPSPKGIQCRLNISPVMKEDKPEEKGILFDADIYVEKVTSIHEVKSIMKSFKDYIEKKDGLKSFILKILKDEANGTI